MQKNGEVAPLGKVFADFAKNYLGALAEKLEKKTGINRYFYALLKIHQGKSSITQQQLSEILKTDKVTTVRVIDYLSEKGYVKRQVNINDRREHLLVVTPKGEKLIPHIMNAYNELNEHVFEGMSVQKKKNFMECLVLIESNLSKLPSSKVNIKMVPSNSKKSKK